MEKQIAEIGGIILEIAGIAIILLYALYSTILALYSLIQKKNKNDIYKHYRSQFGRGVLLGLEFLVGADIIQTVAVDITFDNIALLAAIVLIRTFLSFTLELEISGKWPWQKKQQT